MRLRPLLDRLRHDPPVGAVVGAVIGLVVVTGIVDVITGPDVPVDLLYFVPLLLVAWTFGRWWGLGTAVVLATEVVVINQREHPIAAWTPALAYLTQLAVYALLVLVTAALRHQLDEVERRATVDLLTGVASRRHFLDLSDHALAVAHRTAQPLSLLYLDADGLKRVNDEEGHHAGDALLRRFGAVLQSEVRAADVVGRLGGDEFAVLLSGDDRTAAGAAADRLLQAMAADPDGPIGASIGVVALTPDEAGRTTTDELLARGDQLMYEAKRAGGSRAAAGGLEGASSPQEQP